MTKRSSQWMMSLAWIVLAASPVAASSGTVTGKLQFYQNQGNYCPTTRSCTGAKYPQSQYHTNRPVQNVKVYAYRASPYGLIGSGTTDASGNFSFTWSDPSAGGTVIGLIQWFGEHKDGRFSLANASGGLVSGLTSSNKFLFNGITTSLGNLTWGSASSPNALANLYDGAHMEWVNSLSQSNRMNSFFSGVQIRAFDTVCPTSCAYGPTNTITIDSAGSAYMPQARVMHEMGHIASYRSSAGNSYTSGLDYGYGGDTSNTWSLGSAEYGAVHFEEGVATHLGDIGLYFNNAPAPHTCLSSSACPTDFYNIETSLGTSCATDVNRQPINAIRYFWDIYDTVVDSTYADNISAGPSAAEDVIQFLVNGTDNLQKDEPWNASYSALDDRDGRSCIDFRQAGILVGLMSTPQLANNCGSVGD